MCLSKKYDSKDFEVVFVLDKYGKKMIITAVIQTILMLGGLLIIVLPPIRDAINSSTVGYLNFIIGAVIFCFFAFVPRPVFWHYDMIGDVYLVFDESKFKLYLLEGKFFNCRWRFREVGHYGLFRGIAWNPKKRRLCFYAKGSSHSPYQPGGGEGRKEKDNLNPFFFFKDLIEKVSMWWFENKSEEFDQKVYFGVTVLPFEEGLQDDQGVSVDIDFDYYKKKNDDVVAGDEVEVAEPKTRGDDDFVEDDADEVAAANVASDDENKEYV
ncbi:hypothetical protein RFI_13658 [Reticulomyxa filosa]|uniref:Uncharacterized protein n=1 Tax=Reticulomyxa filosa TaxID=46433 RepID=X6NB57_RETFI|nr:hypothetical protein RFI_13658 [Reticulomyxa filosa]|eukprot:ETO23520.1 hypothetical protein RFI_13658 [Reticulomyxa filosa]